MSWLKEHDPEVWAALDGERLRQQEQVILIASENTVSAGVREAQASLLTNKYAEGYPGRRYYGGCRFVDVAEDLARQRALRLFPGAEHVNVQPHSGTQANQSVFAAMLEPGNTILSMDLAHGGHLSHGHPANLVGKLYKIERYGVSREAETIDYDALAEQALAVRPRIIVCGASAYSRTIDFERFGAIARDAGALLLADIAHIAGLVAAGLHPSPFPHADFVSTTTHKTLRGPRGGMLFCRSEFAKKIDSALFPGNQGGPLMHVIAAKAVAFGEALAEDFREYQRRIVRTAGRLARGFADRGHRLVSGGTDNHLFLVDLRPRGLTGKLAEQALESAGIVLNKNMIPFDPEKPAVTSGVRVGTPTVASRGMDEPEMDRIAELADRVLSAPEDAAVAGAVTAEVKELCAGFPIERM